MHLEKAAILFLLHNEFGTRKDLPERDAELVPDRIIMRVNS